MTLIRCYVTEKRSIQSVAVQLPKQTDTGHIVCPKPKLYVS